MASFCVAEIIVRDAATQERLLFPASSAASEESCIQRLAKEVLTRLEVADGRRQHSGIGPVLGKLHAQFAHEDRAVLKRVR